MKVYQSFECSTLTRADFLINQEAAKGWTVCKWQTVQGSNYFWVYVLMEKTRHVAGGEQGELSNV